MITIADINILHLEQLLYKYNIELLRVGLHKSIPGCFWGEPEAGIIGNKLYVRNDTPVHSALHESCHFICMDQTRREDLHTNTGGDYDEENAVCFLQIVLANHLPGLDSQKMCEDMDKWGYTFRLGSAKKWFYNDADDAYQWLRDFEILDSQKNPTWQKRI